MVAAPLTAEIVMSVQVTVTSMIYMKIYHWEVKHCKTIMSMMMIAQISKHISFTVCTWQCYDPWACECKSGRNGLRSPSSPSPSPYSSHSYESPLDNIASYQGDTWVHHLQFKSRVKSSVGKPGLPSHQHRVIIIKDWFWILIKKKKCPFAKTHVHRHRLLFDYQTSKQGYPG